MIRFMVLAAPRSGTAWAANWLNDGQVRCLHDPMWDDHYADLDQKYPGFGIACTGIALFHEWVNAHPAPKVILHRPRDEVNASLAGEGLPRCPPLLFKALEQIKGLHVPWTDLFRNARPIWDHLLPPLSMNGRRHAFLCTMRVTAHWRARVQNPNVINRLRAEGMPAILE